MLREEEKFSAPISLALHLGGSSSKDLLIRLPQVEKIWRVQAENLVGLASLPYRELPLLQLLHKHQYPWSNRLEALRATFPAEEQLGHLLLQKGQVSEKELRDTLAYLRQTRAVSSKVPALAEALQGLIPQELWEEIQRRWSQTGLPWSELAKTCGVVPKVLEEATKRARAHLDEKLPRFADVKIGSRIFPRKQLSQLLETHLLEGVSLWEVILGTGTAYGREAEELYLAIQAKWKKPRSVPELGEYLISQGRLTRQELEEALAQQRETDQYLGEVLLEKQLLSPEELQESLEKIHTLERRAYHPDRLFLLLERRTQFSLEELEKVLLPPHQWEYQFCEYSLKKSLLSQELLDRLVHQWAQQEVFQLSVYPELPCVLVQDYMPEPHFSTLATPLPLSELLSKVYDQLSEREREQFWSLGPYTLFEANQKLSWSGKSLDQHFHWQEGWQSLAIPLAEWQNLLRQWREKGLILRLSESQVWQLAQEAEEKGDWKNADAYYKLLEKGLIAPQRAKEARQKVIQSWKKRRKILQVFALLILLGLGVSIFALGSPSGTDKASVEPEKSPLEDAKELHRKGQLKAAFQKYADLYRKGKLTHRPALFQVEPQGAVVEANGKVLHTLTQQLTLILLPKKVQSVWLKKKGYLPLEVTPSLEEVTKVQLTPYTLWRWQSPTPLSALPLQVGKWLYLPLRDGTVRLLHLDTGAEIGKIHVSFFGDILYRPLWDGKSHLWLTSASGKVLFLALGKTHPQQSWDLGRTILFPPLLILEQIALVTHKGLYCITSSSPSRPSLKLSWLAPPQQAPWGKESTLLLISWQNQLQIWRLSSSQLLASHQLSSLPVSPPRIWKSKVYWIFPHSLHWWSPETGERGHQKTKATLKALETIPTGLLTVHPTGVSLWDEQGKLLRSYSFSPPTPWTVTPPYLLYWNEDKVKLIRLETGSETWQGWISPPQSKPFWCGVTSELILMATRTGELVAWRRNPQKTKEK